MNGAQQIHVNHATSENDEVCDGTSGIRANRGSREGNIVGGKTAFVRGSGAGTDDV